MKEQLNTLWNKYANRTATRKELETFLELLENNQASEEVTQWMEQKWNTATMPAEVTQVRNKVWNNITTTIQTKATPKKSKVFRLHTWYKVAAAVVLLIGVGSMAYFGTNIYNALSYDSVSVAANENPQQFTLPDGSEVWLNSGTTLYYDKSFQENRFSKLDGEAFFKVTKNKERPFIIKTGDISTRVVGTQFNVKEDKNHIKVTVTEGEVRVYNQKDTLQLTPNKQGVYALNSQQLTEQPVNAFLYGLWQKEEIELNSVTMKDFAVALETVFHVKTQFADEKAKEVLMSFSFSKTESIENIIARINIINEVQLTQKQHMITIKKVE
ncbi:iron dicitrate transporter FecR [Neptunitalea chrysea]|uniref:Iron dicitrate transporter FecR n=1 Tax=Neptunitalea chrysea TaxID=1647581 RepID=A0A9W6EVV1_9FLAO|nr:FecR family protein [Neptunitalea chrysea]GLB52972.1 iron dicitrate transporter FecR [Neptunitalea chrysea]